MSERKSRYLQILYAPKDVKFTITKDGTQKEISREEALKQAKEAYDMEIQGYTEQAIQKKEREQRVVTGAGLTVQALTRPEVGDALLREFKEKLDWKWAELTGAGKEAVQKELDEAYDAQMARYEAQGEIRKDFVEVQEKGTWEAYAEFFAPEIKFGITLAVSYGIGAVVGRLAPVVSGVLKAKGITTIARMKPSTIAKIGGYVLMGTYFAPTVVSATQAIIDAEDRKKETTNKWELEQLERQKWAGIGTLFQSSFQYLAMVRVGQAGYKYGYGRGAQAAFLKQFPKGTPQREFVRRGIKSTRLLQKVKTKFERPVYRTETVEPYKFKEAKLLIAEKKGVLGGSTASYAQIKEARFPKDVDIYFTKSKNVEFAKTQLGGKEAGFDIHGPEMYTPEAYMGQGWWTQKPVRISGVKQVSAGEQLVRKFKGSAEYLGGMTHVGRAKDVPDYWKHFESQYASTQLSYNPITRLKGRLALRYMKPYVEQPTKVISLEPIGTGKIPTTTTPKLPATRTPIIKTYPKYQKLPTTYPVTKYQKPTTVTYPKPTPYPKMQYPTSKYMQPYPTTYYQPSKPTPIKQTKQAVRKTIVPPPRKKEEAYEVHSGGRRLNTQPLNLQTAKSVGADYTDKNISTKFTIKETRGPPAPVRRYEWNTIKHKFKRKGNVYYEKKKYQKDYDIERKRYQKPQKRGSKAKKQYFSIIPLGGKK